MRISDWSSDVCSSDLGGPGSKPYFTLPEAAVEGQVATLPGLYGRKMSKSYDNTIPLFAPAAELKKLIYSIVTDSRKPGEPKQVEGSALFEVFQAFASEPEVAAMREAFATGIGWGSAKELLFIRIDAEVAPLRARYARSEERRVGKGWVRTWK